MNGQYHIVLAGYVGLGGTMEILAANRELLGQRFSPAFLHQTEQRKKYLLSDLQIQKLWEGKSTAALQTVGDGGILAALWELAEQMKSGLVTSFWQMPIWQETIELCEYGRFHPYTMSDYGSALLAVPDGIELVNRLQGSYPLAVIGQLIPGRERVILKDGEKRYLEKPRRRQYEKTDFKMH